MIGAPHAEEIRFYCTADAHAFVGVVGLLNSLRLVGHDEPLYLVDCGLTAQQRALLEPHARVVDGPELHPALLKSWAPLAYPAEVMAVLDADVIVVRPLDELFDAARGGSIVAFRDDLGRYHSEWGELLGFGPLPQRPYVNSGHLVFPRARGTGVLKAQQQGISRLGLADEVPQGAPPRTRSRQDPFFYSDQDVLNAVLAATVPDDRILLLESRLAPFPPFRGLRADLATLRCDYADGMSPYVLHHVGEKPWLAATLDTVYVRLLSRLLTSADVRVRLPEHLLPLRLRTGTLARADRARAHIQRLAYNRARGRLGIRPHVEAFLARRRN